MKMENLHYRFEEIGNSFSQINDAYRLKILPIQSGIPVLHELSK